MLLHGRATSEADLHPLLDALDPERRLLGLTPGAPLTGIPPGGRHWYVIEEVGRPDVETFVESMGPDRRLRRRPPAAAGHRLGGHDRSAASAREGPSPWRSPSGTGRPRPAGILAMSCFLPMVRGWRIDVRAKRGTPAYLTHGTYDNIIPVGFGRRVRDELVEGGLEVIYRETRVQHQIDPELLPEMRAWVLAKTGGPDPVRDGPKSQI